MLRRWVTATVDPVAERMKATATAYINGDYDVFTEQMATPIFGLVTATRQSHNLKLLLTHILKSSRGRPSYGHDLALVAMSVAIRLTTRPEAKPPGLSSTIANIADQLRSTVLSQLIEQMQGTKALEAIQKVKPGRPLAPGSKRYRERMDMKRIANMLIGQARGQLEEAERGEREIAYSGSKAVLWVIDKEQRSRRIELVPPDANDWEVLRLAASEENNGYKSDWIALATMFVVAIQAEFGWFDVAETRVRQHMRGRIDKRRVLLLTQEAQDAISRDIERWVALGFQFRPMIVEPEDGGYLTVKLKKVSTRYAPMGLITDATDTIHWRRMTQLANSAWRVNKPLLQKAKNGSPFYAELLNRGSPDKIATATILAEHSRDAEEPALFLPIYLDFRGRAYLRTPWVNYQGSDLQRGLLQFAARVDQDPSQPRRQTPLTDAAEEALAKHFTSLMDKDKEPLSKRRELFDQLRMYPVLPDPVIDEADAPWTLMGHWELLRYGEWDDIPIQLDGTCNGLQHLSAMFRDPVGAQLVNLTADHNRELASDAYGVVATDLMSEVATRMITDARLHRIYTSGLTINRKLTKRPVMVLPYGGTLMTIAGAVYDATLSQLGDRMDTPWHEWTSDGYDAFKDRPLADHPLFRRDMEYLGKVLFERIENRLPAAIAAMDTFRAIGSYVGDRALIWQVGGYGVVSYSSPYEAPPLEVVQAKPKSAMSTLRTRGLHLPGIARGLSVRMGKDEIDAAYQRTGIVANFIHSQDALHMGTTVARLSRPVGAIHDALLVRPSQAEAAHKVLRESFADIYAADAEWPNYQHPLKRPVRIDDGKGNLEEFKDWFALAKAAGTSFPDFGKWSPSEVLENPWFFS